MLLFRAPDALRTCAIALLASLIAVQGQAQDTRFREETKPPVTLTGLQDLPGPTPRAPCDLPAVSLLGAALTFTDLPDSSTMPLPAGWRRLPLFESDRVSSDTRIAAADETRIRIRRERNAARGRAYLIYRSGDIPEGDTCVLSRGRAGAIWTFYAPDPDVRDPLAYGAFGNVMTPAGRWYSLTLWAATPEQRALAASTITELILNPGNK